MKVFGYGYGPVFNRKLRLYQAIVTALNIRLNASGVSVGRMLCLSGYINTNVSGNTLSENAATELWLRLQAASIVTSNNACITNYLSNLTGEN